MSDVTGFNRRRRAAAKKAAAPAPPPAIGTAEHYATLTAPQVLAALEANEYTTEAALEFEEARKEPRKTVLEVLQPDENQEDGDSNDEPESEETPDGESEDGQKGE